MRKIMNKVERKQSEHVLVVDTDGGRAWVMTEVGAVGLGVNKVVTVLRDFGIPQEQREDICKECWE